MKQNKYNRSFIRGYKLAIVVAMLVVVGIAFDLQPGIRHLLIHVSDVQKHSFTAGEVKIISISITNLYWKTSQVTAISTCGCTSVQVTPLVLSAFSHGRLRLAINTKGLPPGQHSRTVFIVANEQQKISESDLTIHFTVR